MKDIRRFSSKNDKSKKTDHYQVLGLEREAENKDVKEAFYKLSKQYHPDVNKEEGAVEKFQDITDAYEVLSSADSRAAYDRQTQMQASHVTVAQRKHPSTVSVNEDYTQFFKTRREQRKEHDAKRSKFKSRMNEPFRSSGTFSYDPFVSESSDPVHHKEPVHHERPADVGDVETAVAKRKGRREGEFFVGAIFFFSVFIYCVLFPVWQQGYVSKGMMKKQLEMKQKSNNLNNPSSNILSNQSLDK